jgi:hypothetical protein
MFETQGLGMGQKKYAIKAEFRERLSPLWGIPRNFFGAQCKNR